MRRAPVYEITPATLNDVPELSGLFDAYRVFYNAESLPEECEIFIRGLVGLGNTRFFVAREAEGFPALGFTHLIPAISTVAMRPMWYLEDLYVVPKSRREGVASALMRHAESFARETGAERLTLATAQNNHKAQSLYKRMGYLREEHFWYFHRTLDGDNPAE